MTSGSHTSSALEQWKPNLGDRVVKGGAAGYVRYLGEVLLSVSKLANLANSDSPMGGT